MIFCQDCDKKISEEAVSCPNCGRPNKINKDLSTILIIGIILLPMIFAWFTLRKGTSITARIVSFTWMIIAIIANGEWVNPPI